MRSLMKTLKSLRRRQDGSATIEALLVVPMIVGALTMAYTIHGLYRATSVETKANYALADAVSRERRAITPEFLSSLYELHRLVGHANQGSAVRMSVVDWDPETKSYRIRWTREKSTLAKALPVLTPAAVADIAPTLSDYEAVIVMESFKEYTPFRDIGINPSIYQTRTVTRPRFSPQVCWTEGQAQPTC